MSAQELRTSAGTAILTSLDKLPLDMKRMLRVQIKELIHTIEDCEGGRYRREPQRFGPQAA